MHAAPTDMGLAVGGRGNAIVAGTDVRLVGLGLAPPFRLVQRRGGDEVLNDGAVYDELVRRALGTSGGRFGDDGLEDRVLMVLT